MKGDHSQGKAAIVGTTQLDYHPYDTVEKVIVVIVLEQLYFVTNVGDVP